MEGLKEALKYLADMGANSEKTEVIEICGKTYANRKLERYDTSKKACAMKTKTLSSLVEYMERCSSEFPERQMIVHVEDPKTVVLKSGLDAERERESLMIVSAETSEFRFDSWYDQERFMIELQANFQKTDDLELILKAAGNIDKKNSQAYSDDGISQVATMTVGVATKADVIVPNPVRLTPYRTFQEIEQPSSDFVFRIGNENEPTFKLVEAQNGIWKNEAIERIKSYIRIALEKFPDDLREQIIVIG